jgi:hypothetical protein
LVDTARTSTNKSNKSNKSKCQSIGPLFRCARDTSNLAYLLFTGTRSDILRTYCIANGIDPCRGDLVTIIPVPKDVVRL